MRKNTEVPLPDPENRIQVLAVTRGLDVYVELIDDHTKQGVVMDIASALRAASDINREVARVIEQVAEQIEDGTVPVWEGNPLERRHGQGAADLN